MKLELSGNAQKTSMKSEFAPHVAQTPSNTTTQSSSEGIKVRSVQRCSFVFCFFFRCEMFCSRSAIHGKWSSCVWFTYFSLSRWMMAPCVSAVPRPDVQGSATASTRGRRYDTPWINHPFITLHTGAKDVILLGPECILCAVAVFFFFFSLLC